MMMVAVEDAESQRKGLVVINWPNSTVPLLPERKEHVLGQQVLQALPLRICAAHVCLPDDHLFRILKANLALIMGKEDRTRMKFHLGERTEIQYALQGYGIPVDQIPVTETGNVKLNNLHQWIKVRRAIENNISSSSSPEQGRAASSKSSIVECPAMNDVIFRLGKSYLVHPGNTMFRNIIESKYEEHNDAKTQERKVAITWWVIDEVLQRRSGRFLVWDSRGGWWTEAKDRSQIRSKVAVYIREFKKKVKAKQKIQFNESSTFKFERQDLRKRKRSDNNNNNNGDGGMLIGGGGGGGTSRTCCTDGCFFGQ
jgi:hypothetical protein